MGWDDLMLAVIVSTLYMYLLFSSGKGRDANQLSTCSIGETTHAFQLSTCNGMLPLDMGRDDLMLAVSFSAL
jgi:hypothetical protein